MAYYAGVDWGGAGHAVCIIDDAGRIIERFEVRHDAEGITGLIGRLSRVAAAAEMPIAIERPSGLLVDSLVAAEYPIVPIHPNVVKACRPRYRAAGGKSDPGDSFMLADILRTDGHRFRRLTPCSDDIKALRALVRGRDDLVGQRLSLANQLRGLLDSFWPGAAGIFADIDSPIALAFVRRYPTPDSAAHLGEKRMKAFMAQHRYSGRRSAGELLERLRRAPTGLAGDNETDAKGELARALASLLIGLQAQIGQLSSRISTPSPSCRMARSSCPSPGPAASARPRSSPSWAMYESASKPKPSSPPRPGSARSPVSPARAAPSSSAGPATIACAPPSPALPITPGIARHGPQTSTTAPEPAAATTRTPSASSPALGFASFGELGPTAQNTIQRDTKPPSI
jgi:Transposase